MALYEKLSASSTPQEIADAYEEFAGTAGGDTAAVQKQAVDYLSNLGIATPTIEQAYGAYLKPTTVSNLPTTSTATSTTTSAPLGGTTSNLTSTVDTNLGKNTSTPLDVLSSTPLIPKDDDRLDPVGDGTFRNKRGEIVDANGNAVQQKPVTEYNGLVDLGNGTYRTYSGDIIDSNGYPVTFTTPPADNVSNSGYTKPTTGLSGVAGQGAIEGDNIEQQIAQLPQEYAHWERSADQRTMNLIRKSDGAVLDQRAVGDFSDVDLLKIGLSFIPGAAPILAGLNIADAARTGNWMNAAIGATGLIPGMQNINTALRVGQAVDNNNAFGAITALAGNSDLQKYFGANDLKIGGYTARDAISAANLYTAANNGQWASAIANAGALVNSPDAVLAGKALAVLQAAESANPNALSMAVSAFNSVGGSGGLPTTTGSTTVSDSVPLTDEEIADLNPDQLRVYQESGVAGLRDYNRAIKNLTSLTTSGYTGDSMGGNDTLTTSGGGTRGLTNTTTTNTNFEDSEITRLRGLGMTNAQISEYLDNLNNLTASLDSTDTSGLSDFGLAAFRQAKTAGATDIEALAAANLAVSGRYTNTGVETDASTGVELVVTEKNDETNIYSFYETQSEFETGTELIVTSGRETGQQTEIETELETMTEMVVTSGRETKPTETTTEIIVTSGRETETATETMTEIVVTTSSETESEIDTLTEIIVTTSSETETFTVTETETDTLTEIIVTTSSETRTETETETITEVIVTTSTETEAETETETLTKIITKPVITKPATTSAGTFVAGTPAQGGRGKPTEFLKEQLLKTYMTKDSFKDPLAQFNKARQELSKDDMMQQGVDPRLAAILAAKMNGEEPPPAPSYNYGEEPSSIDDILSLKGEGDQYFAKGGYVQPLMAQGGMALPLLAAKGGLPTMHKGREDFRQGKHVAGEGDGQSDDIPAMLADGEFVFPADVVSALGNGSTKAGTDKLYEMMHAIRDRARSKGSKDLPPPALKSPLDYLKKR